MCTLGMTSMFLFCITGMDGGGRDEEGTGEERRGKKRGEEKAGEEERERKGNDELNVQERRGGRSAAP